MREHKYRGKSIETGEWVYGYYAKLLSRGRRKPFIYSLIGEKWTEVDPETVGEYIGQNDKDGFEIYEGDKISDDVLENLVIVWSDKLHSWSFGCVENGEIYCNLSEDAALLIWDIYFGNCKITGSIHEGEK